MLDQLEKIKNADAIITIQNKERSACKITSYALEDELLTIQFESIFPVRELNADQEGADWSIDLGTTVFGKEFAFQVDGDITFEENHIIFTEMDRGLQIEVVFDKKTVDNKMLSYIDALV